MLWHIPEAHIVTLSKHNPSAHIQCYWCRAFAVGRMSSWVNLPPTSPHPSFENLLGVLQLVHLSPLAPQCQKQSRHLENRRLLSSFKLPIWGSLEPSPLILIYLWCTRYLGGFDYLGLRLVWYGSRAAPSPQGTCTTSCLYT